MADLAQFKVGAALPSAREGRAPVRDRLIAMLFLAALLHAIIILGITFRSGLTGSDHTPTLEVLLVSNEAASANRNDAAHYLAQRTQLGSGTTRANVPAGSPAPRLGAAGAGAAPVPVAAGDDTVLSSTAPSSDIRYFSAPQPQVEPAGLPEFEDQGPPRSGRGDADALTLQGAQRPELWVTPDTRASELAPYLAAWKRKVERMGTLNFPAAARDSGLSGSPVVEVAVRADGRLTEARVRRSSGHGEIDQAALAILRLASPFDPFPPELAAHYDSLRFAYEWEFVAGRLESGAVTTSADTASGP